jgi:Zn-dependent protease with chaperone function
MLPVNGLYGHIARNNALSLALIAGFVVAACVLWVVVAIWGLLASVVLTGLFGAVTGNAVAFKATMALMAQPEALIKSFHIPMLVSALTVAIGLLFLRRIIQHLTGAKGVERREEPRLYNAVETLAIAAGLPMPRIEIIEQSGLNAYATGLSPRFTTIAVTRGLLKALDDRELEAVLAHEIAHIKNRDTRVMAIAALFGGLLAKVADTVWVVFLRRPLSLNDTFQVMGDARDGRATTDEQSRRLKRLLAFVVVLLGYPLFGFHLRTTFGFDGPLILQIIQSGLWVWGAACLWLAFGEQVKAYLRGDLQLEKRHLAPAIITACVILIAIVPRIGNPLPDLPRTCDQQDGMCRSETISSEIRSRIGATRPEPVSPQTSSPTSPRAIAAKVSPDEPSMVLAVLAMVLVPILYIGGILYLVYRGIRRLVGFLAPSLVNTPQPSIEEVRAHRSSALLPSLAMAVIGPLWLLNLLSGALVSVVYATSAQVRGGITRAREYMADAVAVELIKDANPLVSALRKIDRHDTVADVPAAFLATLISGPSIGWLATHPTISQRIAALRAHGGATVPIPRHTAANTQQFSPAPSPERRPRIVQGLRADIPRSIG